MTDIVELGSSTKLGEIVETEPVRPLVRAANRAIGAGSMALVVPRHPLYHTERIICSDG